MTDMREKLISLIMDVTIPVMNGKFKIGEMELTEGEAAAVADHLIANGVTVQRWIPVTDRLPEDLPENRGKKVIPCLVSVASVYKNGKPNTQFRQRKYDPYMGWYWSKMGSCRVVHWMPLPEPVKEDTHEE